MQNSDSKLINDVIDRLKKHGLFDKFRKECMADVDTKPAYQNLTHRVQGAVEQFLSSQKWHPDLNKNQLRESLRRHLNDLHTLSVGVERVVDQVVNQKIYKDIKPPIDRVICEELGIDFDRWMARQNPRRNTLVQPGGISTPIPSLLDIRLDGPPRSGFPSAPREMPPVLPPPSIPPPVLGPRRLQAPPSGLLQPTMPAVIIPPRGPVLNAGPIPPANIPGVLGPPPSMPLGPNHLPFPDINLLSSVPPPTIGHMNIGDVHGININEQPHMQYPPSVGQQFGGVPYEYEASSGFYSGFGDQSFTPPAQPSSSYTSLPVGLPAGNFVFGSGTGIVAATGLPGVEQVTTELTGKDATTQPAQPMTKTARDREARQKRKERKKQIEPLSVESLLNVAKVKPKDADKKSDEPASTAKEDVSVDKPASLSGKTDSTSVGMERTAARVEVKETSNTNGIATSAEREKSKKPVKEYHFSWDEVDDGNISDVTVSSVHTSDLSSFDDDTEQLPTPVELDADDNDAGADDDNVKNDASDTVPAESESSAALKSENSNAVTKSTSEQLTSTVKQRKPQKLIALQYNYSDSENEETREQRKARLAEEKEQRYLRRQQRRAELEQKRKERQDEKAKVKKSVSEIKAHQLPITSTKTNKDAKCAEAVKETPEDMDDKKISTDETLDVSGPTTPATKSSDTKSSDNLLSSQEKFGASPGGKRHRTKAELKEELREKKVQEKQRELRRQRTRNRKYLSDDFTSIFTEKKDLLASSGYTVEEKKDASGTNFVSEEIVETVVEQLVEIDSTEDVIAECVEVGSSSSSDRGDSRAVSPYSDISNSSVYSISSESTSSAEAHSLRTSKPPMYRRTRDDYHDDRTQSSDEGRYSNKKCVSSRQDVLQNSSRSRRESPYERVRQLEDSPRGSSNKLTTDSPYSTGRSRPCSSQSSGRQRLDTSQDSYRSNKDSVRVRGKSRDNSPWSAARSGHGSPHDAGRQLHRSNSGANVHRVEQASVDNGRRSSHSVQKYCSTDTFKGHVSQRQQSQSPSSLADSRRHQRHLNKSEKSHRHSPGRSGSIGSHSPVSRTGSYRISPSGSPRTRRDIASPTISPRRRHATAFRKGSPDDTKQPRDDVVTWTIDSDGDSDVECQKPSGMVEYDETVRKTSARYEEAVDKGESSERWRHLSSVELKARPFQRESSLLQSYPQATTYMHGAIVRQPGGWRSSSRRSAAGSQEYYNYYAGYDIQHASASEYHSSPYVQVTGSPRYVEASRSSRPIAAESDWQRTSSSQNDSRTGTSPAWNTKSTYPGSPSVHSLPAPPKPRRSRSPGERSSSSSSRSQSREYDPVQWDEAGQREIHSHSDDIRSPHRSTSGYPRVYHPDGSHGPGSLKTLSQEEIGHIGDHDISSYGGRHLRLSTSLMDDSDSVQLGRTRASHRRSEEENAPIAKRLRR